MLLFFKLHLSPIYIRSVNCHSNVEWSISDTKPAFIYDSINLFRFKLQNITLNVNTNDETNKLKYDDLIKLFNGLTIFDSLKDYKADNDEVEVDQNRFKKESNEFIDKVNNNAINEKSIYKFGSKNFNSIKQSRLVNQLNSFSSKNLLLSNDHSNDKNNLKYNYKINNRIESKSIETSDLKKNVTKKLNQFIGQSIDKNELNKSAKKQNNSSNNNQILNFFRNQFFCLNNETKLNCFLFKKLNGSSITLFNATESDTEFLKANLTVKSFFERSLNKSIHNSLNKIFLNASNNETSLGVSYSKSFFKVFLISPNFELLFRTFLNSKEYLNSFYYYFTLKPSFYLLSKETLKSFSSFLKASSESSESVAKSNKSSKVKLIYENKNWILDYFLNGSVNNKMYLILITDSTLDQTIDLKMKKEATDVHQFKKKVPKLIRKKRFKNFDNLLLLNDHKASNGKLKSTNLEQSNTNLKNDNLTSRTDFEKHQLNGNSIKDKDKENKLNKKILDKDSLKILNNNQDSRTISNKFENKSTVNRLSIFNKSLNEIRSFNKGNNKNENTIEHKHPDEFKMNISELLDLTNSNNNYIESLNKSSSIKLQNRTTDTNGLLIDKLKKQPNYERNNQIQFDHNHQNGLNEKYKHKNQINLDSKNTHNDRIDDSKKHQLNEKLTNQLNQQPLNTNINTKFDFLISNLLNLSKNQTLNSTINQLNQQASNQLDRDELTSSNIEKSDNNNINNNNSFYAYDNDEPVYYLNPEEMLEPWSQNPYFFPLIITFLISFLVGVTGNVLVIWLMLANKDNRK